MLNFKAYWQSRFLFWNTKWNKNSQERFELLGHVPQFIFWFVFMFEKLTKQGLLTNMFPVLATSNEAYTGKVFVKSDDNDLSYCKKLKNCH